MKKNGTMRVATLLLALTLITSCFVGGTFAKYTTSADATDSAQVAKFGVTVTANGETFAGTYDDAVSAGGEYNVVAPGTDGKMVSMTLIGTPEVAVKVTYAAEFDLGENWVVDSAYYCPLVITVNGTEISGLDYNTSASFEEAVEAAINGYSKEYAPGTKLNEKGTDSLAVSWEWKYAGNDDVNDTALGDAANAASVSLTVTTTVTQLETYTPAQSDSSDSEPTT